MINAIHIALSGLQAASRRVEASASNIANLQTPDYKAQTTLQTAQNDGAGQGSGVTAQNIPKTSPYTPSYDPDSPFANGQGIVNTPNVDLAEEAVNMSLADTAYRASVAVIKTTDEMTQDMLKAFDRKA